MRKKDYLTSSFSHHGPYFGFVLQIGHLEYGPCIGTKSQRLFNVYAPFPVPTPNIGKYNIC